jgi:hypothetical protein
MDFRRGRRARNGRPGIDARLTENVQLVRENRCDFSSGSQGKAKQLRSRVLPRELAFKLRQFFL